jgi:L-ascorbate metabolism protein UlaG (beta-lactamase superfamily)
MISASPSNNPEPAFTFRWLGAAGIELAASGKVLLIDPCLTRIRFWQLWLGYLHPDQGLLRQHISRADAILVTHAHYDHLLDTPGLAAFTGAKIYGSANACQICHLSDLPEGQVERIFAGQSLRLPGFTVQVYPARHRWVPFFTPGPLSPGLRTPFTARQYRLDEDFSFQVTMAGIRLLIDSGSDPQDLPPADVLLVHPFHREDHYRQLLEVAQPRLVIPTHWDDLWTPLSKPTRPTYQPPRWAFPPVQRVDLAVFQEMIRKLAPGVNVFLPRRLAVIDLPSLIHPLSS